MTSKTEMLYKVVFENILNLLKINNRDMNYNQFTHIHADFENVQINAFRLVFGAKIIFRGYHFHFIKPLYNRLKMNGLMKYQFRKFNKDLISILKFIPCLHIDMRRKFYLTFIRYFSSAIIDVDIPLRFRSKYISFLEYLKKKLDRFRANMV